VIILKKEQLPWVFAFLTKDLKLIHTNCTLPFLKHNDVPKRYWKASQSGKNFLKKVVLMPKR